VGGLKVSRSVGLAPRGIVTASRGSRSDANALLAEARDEGRAPPTPLPQVPREA